jgi:aryl-alcohol dehydrogenase-like predicted oxidoreductase
VELVSLGKTDIRTPPLGIGAWAWGDKLFWEFGKDYNGADTAKAFTGAVKAGITMFDTAEIYGRGLSERLLGEYMQYQNGKCVVVTKFMPWPWRLLGKESLRRAVVRSLRRLHLPSVDLYLIHWPVHILPIKLWMNAMADVLEEGLIKAVGVSNYNARQMAEAHVSLAERNIPLAVNQVEYSVWHRSPERNGVMKLCKELNVTLMAYSPLAMGMLTGKYSPGNPPHGIRGKRYTMRALRRLYSLSELMKRIGRAYGDKTPSQVALNWTICKGTVPIPGAKNEAQAYENAGALGWRLSDEDIALLDAA